MEIDETINNWINETEGLLQELGLPNCKVDVMVLSAIPTIDNYLNSALLILNNGNRLPAMALLRSVGELATRIIYCLMAKDSTEQNVRVQRWEKHSLQERKRLYEKFLKRYEQNQNQSKIEEMQRWIDQTEDKIKKIKIRGLPKNQDIFLEVFDEKHPVGQEGFYHIYLCAIHVDLETLNKTMQNGEYTGDWEYDIEVLKYECLTLLYFFLREVYKNYELNLQRINSDYDEWLQRTLKRING
ncbi:MAG: hypothetical protein JW837_11170 [Sedimentisphaerales bacterium]|nr:hypothetical protein [Sedimentisphaerales bacterium]